LLAAVLSASTVVQLAIVGSQHVATTTEQLQVVQTVVLRVSILVVYSQRDQTRHRMDPTPTALLTLPTRTLKKPTTNVSRHPPFTTATIDLSSQPGLDVLLVLVLHLAGNGAVPGPKVLDCGTARRAPSPGLP